MKRIVVALVLAAACYAGSANAYQLNATGSNPLTFGVGATSSTVAEKMRITSAGLIGIGTATPTTAFTVSGTISATSFVGNGSGLTNLPASNLSETIAINDLSDASASVVNGSVFLGANGGGVNTTGQNNTAVGVNALASNTIGSYNTANGSPALAKNTSGSGNTANGYQSMFKNTTGSSNLANGAQALYNNTIGINNTINGYQSMFNNTTGSNNATNGYQSMFNNTSGSSNVADGTQALYYANPVTNTVAVGSNAGVGVNGSTTFQNGTFLGYSSGQGITTGNDNTFLGAYAGGTTTTGSSNTLIGVLAYAPSAAVSNYLNIGNAISGSMLSGGSLTFIGGIKANGVVTATYFEGDGSRLTSVSATIDRLISNTSYAVAQSGGTVLVSGSMYINNAFGGADAALRIGANPTASHYAYIDMAGDTTYTGYGLRIIRYNTGANAPSQIFHRGTGDFALYTQEAAPITFTTSSTERMRIDATGNVGIGITAPSTNLEVSGTVSATVGAFSAPGSGNIGLTVTTNGTVSTAPTSGGHGLVNFVLADTGSDVFGGIKFSAYDDTFVARHGGFIMFGKEGSWTAAGNSFPSYLGFWTRQNNASGGSEVERIHIASTGFVGIGTATPSVVLHVSGTLRVQNGVVVTCNIGTGTGTTSCTSDKRLKTDITPIPDSLEKIATLSGVTFHWKDPTAPKGEHLGVIAQDVEKVFPQAVATMENGYKTVDYGVLIAPLIEAVKQLRTENLALKAENMALKDEQVRTNARFDALERRLAPLIQPPVSPGPH